MIAASAGNHAQGVAFVAQALRRARHDRDAGRHAADQGQRHARARRRGDAASARATTTPRPRRRASRPSAGSTLVPSVRRRRGDRGAGHDRARAARAGAGPATRSWCRSAAAGSPAGIARRDPGAAARGRGLRRADARWCRRCTRRSRSGAPVLLDARAHARRRHRGARGQRAHARDRARSYLDGVALVDEEEIAEAILLLLEQEKTVAEGAGAAALAAVLQGELPLAGKRVVVIVSGGNIDVNLLSRDHRSRPGEVGSLHARVGADPGRARLARRAARHDRAAAGERAAGPPRPAGGAHRRRA